jgi:hypothetical protein
LEQKNLTPEYTFMTPELLSSISGIALSLLFSGTCPE